MSRTQIYGAQLYGCECVCQVCVCVCLYVICIYIYIYTNPGVNALFTLGKNIK
jgi:hypothetical protein